MARRATYLLLWVFVFTVPWQNAVVLDSVGSLSRLAGIFVAALGVLVVIVEGRDARLAESHALLIVFVLWVTASGLWAGNTTAVRVNVASTLQFLLLVLLIREFAHESRRQRGLLGAYVSGCAVSAVTTISAALADPSSVRFSVPGSNENALALALALSVPMAWYLSTTSPSMNIRIVSRLHVPVVILGTLLTGSRSGLLVLAIGATAILAFPTPHVRRTFALVSAIVLVLAGAAVALVPPATFDRLATARGELTEGDVGSRQPLWEGTVAIIATEPWFGVGVGESANEIRHANGVQAVPHNTYLTIAADTGLIGLAIFGLVVMSVVVRSRSLPVTDRRLILIVGLALGFGLGGLHLAYQKLTWLIIGLLANHAAPSFDADRRPGSAAARALPHIPMEVPRHA